MNFHRYKPLYPLFKKRAGFTSADAFYDQAWQLAAAQDDPSSANRFHAEKFWMKDGCPYYNVYPTIVPMLTKLKLDIDSSLIRLPMETLEIRLPVKNNPFTWEDKGEEQSIRTILLSECNVKGDHGITLWMDLGEVQNPGVPGFDMPVLTYRNVPTKESLTIESTLNLAADAESLKVGLQLPDDIEIDCLRLVCTLCLIADDPEIITPEVLSKDQRKYKENPDPKYVQKAIRRGKKGWNVGAGIEVVPHLRRPHPALVWTGKGRAIPKIVMRKGSVVHREVVERIPTGHSGEN